MGGALLDDAKEAEILQDAGAQGHSGTWELGDGEGEGDGAGGGDGSPMEVEQDDDQTDDESNDEGEEEKEAEAEDGEAEEGGPAGASLFDDNDDDAEDDQRTAGLGEDEDGRDDVTLDVEASTAAEATASAPRMQQAGAVATPEPKYLTVESVTVGTTTVRYTITQFNIDN